MPAVPKSWKRVLGLTVPRIVRARAILTPSSWLLCVDWSGELPVSRPGALNVDSDALSSRSARRLLPGKSPFNINILPCDSWTQSREGPLHGGSYGKFSDLDGFAISSSPQRQSSPSSHPPEPGLLSVEASGLTRSQVPIPHLGACSIICRAARYGCA
jgi:hypothetical protein